MARALDKFTYHRIPNSTQYVTHRPTSSGRSPPAASPTPVGTHIYTPHHPISPHQTQTNSDDTYLNPTAGVHSALRRVMREIERLLILAPRVAISSSGGSGDGGGAGSKGQQHQQQQALQYVGGRTGAESSSFAFFSFGPNRKNSNTNTQSTP